MNAAVSPITVEALSKKFELGAFRQHMLREQIMRLFRAPFRRGPAKKTGEEFWALQDVSFEIKPGEVVGIIGRNGAGKSTLLKILSKIMMPTTGRVRTFGRVASLLEVGTGFHEELSGRENVYLNGSILGMKKREVEKKLEAIVEFAGVARFLDTPIKRYSSGMRMRLGFAVAAHLDPDVLIVDEVLAVGDAGFQKKCINAMEDMRGGGRTVLFVSHNMSAVEHLCSRTLWMNGGKLHKDGPTHSIIEAYMATFASTSGAADDLAKAEGRRGSGEARFTRVEFLSNERVTQPVTRAGKSVVVRLHYRVNKPILQASIGFQITTDVGALITETSTSHHGITIPTLPEGEGYVDLEIKLLNLLPARYYFSLGISGGFNNHMHDWVENAVHLDIEPAPVYNSSLHIDSRCGLVFFPQTWHLEGLNAEYQLP
jgi:lipopolysaccharide transport system ATP-binding protein